VKRSATSGRPIPSPARGLGAWHRFFTAQDGGPADIPSPPGGGEGWGGGVGERSRIARYPPNPPEQPRRDPPSPPRKRAKEGQGAC